VNPVKAGEGKEREAGVYKPPLPQPSRVSPRVHPDTLCIVLISVAANKQLDRERFAFSCGNGRNFVIWSCDRDRDRVLTAVVLTLDFSPTA